MTKIFEKVVRKIAPFANENPEGSKGIRLLGHRGYVGGMWEEIGELQFGFLVSQGLRPDNYLLDIACGSLRLGVKAIPYLEPGHYLGVEKEEELVRAGLEKELNPIIRCEKKPNIVISSSFEFEKLGQVADFAMAQSLFTHFPPAKIVTCLRKLHSSLGEHGVLYANFFESRTTQENPGRAHDHACFAYTKEEICEFGESNGYKANYIGDWNHPRDQVIVEFRK